MSLNEYVRLIYNSLTGVKPRAGLLPNDSMLTSELVTLIDGKILGTDDDLTWNKVGTGSQVFSNNTSLMSVTAGQYAIAQTLQYAPYFSGKPQVIEFTSENFQPEDGVIKRIGYFSSNTVAPYATLDGFCIETDSTTRYLKCYRSGVETVSIELSQWDTDWVGYNWTGFSVFQLYFLWLGGAALVSFGATNSGFKYQTNAKHIGNAGTICTSPQQPIRYEIRSSTGTGSLRRICSQVSTTGSIQEGGKGLIVYNSATIACNDVGTLYLLKAIRKSSSLKEVAVKITGFSCTSLGSTDSGMLLLMLNPTISGVVTWSANSKIEEATGSGSQVITNVGRAIAGTSVLTEATKAELGLDFLTWLGTRVDGTATVIALGFLSLSLNQSRAGVIDLIEYA